MREMLVKALLGPFFHAGDISGLSENQAVVGLLICSGWRIMSVQTLTALRGLMLNIPVFVSSTFRDFHTERDILNGPVSDRLNESLRRFGAKMHFIDLRWGVDTNDMDEEAAGRKVLDVCLDEVDRAAPLFLGLIGDRYGWISDDKSLLEWTAQRVGLDPERSRECSITELEFAKAGLWDADDTTTPFILFRQVEGTPPHGWADSDPTRISDFKDEVSQRWGNAETVKRYSVAFDQNGQWPTASMQHFEDLAVSLLEPQLLERARSIPRDGTAEEVLFRGSRTRNFGSEELLKSIDFFLRIDSPVVVYGESGAGKSSLLLALEKYLAASGESISGKLPITVIMGLDDRIWTGDELAFEITRCINATLGLSLFDDWRGSPETWRARWRQEMEKVVAEYPDLLFIVDGLEQLVDGAGGFWPVEWLSSRTALAVSSSSRSDVTLLKNSDFKEVLVGPVPANIAREFVEDWERRIRREIGGGARQIIASKQRLPLWIELALDLLLDIDGDDFKSIEDEPDQASAIQNMLADRAWLIPDDLSSAAHHFLETSIASTDRALARAAVGLLGASRIGLSQEQTVNALRDAGFTTNTEISVARLFRSLSNQLAPNGPEKRMRFTHRVFGEAAESFGSPLTHSLLMRIYESDLRNSVETTPKYAALESEDYYDIEHQWKNQRKLAEAFLFHLFSSPAPKGPQNLESIPLALDCLPQTTVYDAAIVTNLLHLPYAIEHLQHLRTAGASFEALRTLLAAADLSPDPQVQTSVASICFEVLNDFPVTAKTVLLRCQALTIAASHTEDVEEARLLLYLAFKNIDPLYDAEPNRVLPAVFYSRAQREMALLDAKAGDTKSALELLFSCQDMLVPALQTRDPRAIEEAIRVLIQIANIHGSTNNGLVIPTLDEAMEIAAILVDGGDGPAASFALAAEATAIRAQFVRKLFPNMAPPVELLEDAVNQFVVATQKVPFGGKYSTDILRTSIELANIYIEMQKEMDAFLRLRASVVALVPFLNSAPPAGWNELAKVFALLLELCESAHSREVRVGAARFVRVHTSRVLAEASSVNLPEAFAIANAAHHALLIGLSQAENLEARLRFMEALTDIAKWIAQTHPDVQCQLNYSYSLRKLYEHYARVGRHEKARAALDTVRKRDIGLAELPEDGQALSQTSQVLTQYCTALVSEYDSPDATVPRFAHTVVLAAPLILRGVPDSLRQEFASAVHDSCVTLLQTDSGTPEQRSMWEAMKEIAEQM
ncbi:protein of unknown function [Corynebacterium coyleae]|uniref:DUF4062 domain-containing protein n=1 Tax=Corynebacterium coyleae TaxID=53374 RepID=A0ABX8KT57_9CORY|nr:DUF4062 domain-containing protein [Corynebacterium coyleae]QXB17941.1 DUF4062 domain-containing protein [Corynebacterium coyleae]WJY79386.1 hypothetical protein CCOY_03850 [Corynebacterium coyleae]SEB77497.1 protein of unknown function [Corynebacterium coyleae]